MNLQEAITALEAAVKEVANAALSDDRTPLHNALALTQAASLVGINEENPDLVILADLNRLKGLNDQFGHQVGDAAIGEVGNLIHRLLVQDFQAQAFRRGGDEFVILLSSRSLEQFKALVKSFASCQFHYEEKSYETSVSFGYVLSTSETDFTQLLARAEVACQIAKSKGDGICVEWTAEVEQQPVDSLRDRCGACGAKITCTVSRDAAPESRRLLWCPCCGQRLGE